MVRGESIENDIRVTIQEETMSGPTATGRNCVAVSKEVTPTKTGSAVTSELNGRRKLSAVAR